jgi:hypothetical protein
MKITHLTAGISNLFQASVTQHISTLSLVGIHLLLRCRKYTSLHASDFVLGLVTVGCYCSEARAYHA